MRILLVDDEEILIDVLQKSLGEKNYAIDAVTDGEQGWIYGSTYTYDLIILDWSLPKLDGISLCQRFRAHGYHLPILFLTARRSSQEKIRGLDAGADDYLCKPVDLEELAARIRALLRRSNSNSHPLLSWGDLQLDPCSCQVTYQGNLLLLTAKEYQLLELFMRHSQEVFSIEDIIESLWSSVEYPSEATVRSHLRYLRQKLKLAGVPEDPIETLRGRGYCLKSLPSDRNSREIFSTLPAKSKDDKLSSEVCLLKAQNLAVLSTSCPKYRYKSNQQLTTLPEDNQPLTEDSPLLLVIDHDRQFTELLSKEAIAQGIRTAIASTPELAKNWLLGLGDGQLPHLVIIRLSFLGWGSNPLSLEEGLSLIAEFNSLVPSIPAIVIADRDQFEDRLLVARQGGSFFLKQPVTPTEAIFFGQKVLGSDSQGKKVMIVDEDVELLRNLPSLLQPWGFKLTTLDDPRQFWDVLEAVNPDLLLLEMEMPYLSGIELCKVVRTHPHWYKLPVLFFSADKNLDMRAQALASGADEFLSKPFVIKELGDRIIHHLERRIV